MLTAVSVARQCGMVAPRDTVILVNAHTDIDNHARIQWEYASEEGKAGEGNEGGEEAEEQEELYSTETSETQGVGTFLMLVLLDAPY